MTRHRTYRVLVRKIESYSIDISAAAETHATAKAKQLWYGGGGRGHFDRVPDSEEPATFEVDEDASLHLRDIANEDRARWAKKALQAFAQETGSDMGREALHDLLCDLGHYARSTGLDFRDELHRAADVCGEEIAEEVHS